MAENKGNPYHDEEGKFTSSNNEGIDKDQEYEEKLQKHLGISGNAPEQEPLWKKAGYDEPVSDIGSAKIRIEKDNGDFYDVSIDIDENKLDSFLKSVNYQLQDNDRELFRDNGVVPTRVLEDLGYKNEEDFLSDLGQYLYENNLVDEDDLEVI